MERHTVWLLNMNVQVEREEEEEEEKKKRGGGVEIVRRTPPR